MKTDPRYELRAPSPQTAIDAAPGRWLSAFPPRVGVTAGDAALFSDARLGWFLSELGDMVAREVLEIGPLEGMHTAMLCAAGASVVAVEANRSAYLRCLVTKEVLGLDARFLCGDATAFLEVQPVDAFDVALALGVLYHQQEPLRFLRALLRVAPVVCVTTHYDEPDVTTPFLTARRGDAVEVSDDEQSYQGRIMTYRGERAAADFCGGAHPYALWLKRDDILDYVTRQGFHIRAVGCDEPEHPLAPAFSFIAERTTYQ